MRGSTPRPPLPSPSLTMPLVTWPLPQSQKNRALLPCCRRQAWLLGLLLVYPERKRHLQDQGQLQA